MAENNIPEEELQNNPEIEEKLPENPTDEEFEASMTGDKPIVTMAEDNVSKANDNSKDEELAKMKDTLIRTIAEMENLRKRTTKEVEDAKKYSITSFAKDMIAVLENLRRAEENIPVEEAENNELFKNINDGIIMTISELLNAFKKHGIERIDPMGEKFDHNLHQAIIQIPSNESEEGTILQVIQAGYVLRDRLLRPAMVGVAKAIAEESAKSDTGE